MIRHGPYQNSAATPNPGHHRPLLTPRVLWIAGSVLLALPMGVLVFVAVAEMAGGDITGAQHVIEAVPLLIVLLAARRYPRLVGIALIGLSSALFALWLVLLGVGAFDTAQDTSLWMWLAAGLVLFFLPFASGVLFLLSCSPWPARFRKT